MGHYADQRLQASWTLRLPTKSPFHFRCTFWKPSHFPTGLEEHDETTSWRTFRFGEAVCGVRFEMDGGHLKATAFTNGHWSNELRGRLAERIEVAYGVQEDVAPFLARAAKIPALAEPVRLLAGMRMSCPESLFEIAVISLLLQNTTIHRSIKMMGSLLQRYGRHVEFDGVRLWCFFPPARIVTVSEEALRLECRLGYRAKYLPPLAKFFSGIDDDALRKRPPTEVLKALQQIRGIGPYTAGIIASHALRDPNAAALDVWNTRLAAQCLLGGREATVSEVGAELERIAPGYAGLALMYLMEHSYLKSPMNPLVSRVGQAAQDRVT